METRNEPDLGKSPLPQPFDYPRPHRGIPGVRLRGRGRVAKARRWHQLIRAGAPQGTWAKVGGRGRRYTCGRRGPARAPQATGHAGLRLGGRPTRDVGQRKTLGAPAHTGERWPDACSAGGGPARASCGAGAPQATWARGRGWGRPHTWGSAGPTRAPQAAGQRGLRAARGPIELRRTGRSIERRGVYG